MAHSCHAGQGEDLHKHTPVAILLFLYNQEPVMLQPYMMLCCGVAMRQDSSEIECCLIPAKVSSPDEH